MARNIGPGFQMAHQDLSGPQVSSPGPTFRLHVIARHRQPLREIVMAQRVHRSRSRRRTLLISQAHFRIMQLRSKSPGNFSTGSSVEGFGAPGKPSAN
jgi:hypothetical protein